MNKSNQDTGYLHSVETFGALDGPGIRYVLFLQGCPLRCGFCHNPDTWQACTGKAVTPEDAFEDILKYKNFISSGGVTLSGGEPLLQPEFCQALISLCHSAGIHCAVDTAGPIPLDFCRQAVDAADLLLLDIKALDPTLCQELTGQDNQNALALLEYCEAAQKAVWIRHVLVPGLTLRRELLENLAEFLSGFSCVEQVELLPFHKMGEYKWEALNLRSPLSGTREPTKAEVAAAKKIFQSRGLSIH